MIDKYLVVTRHDNEECASMWTARSIMDYLDMEDCFQYDEIYVYDVSEIGRISKVTLYGAWHDLNHPLYMKGVNEDGVTVFSGWGTDH